MKRTASAAWNGDLKSGNGTLTTQTKTLSDTPYSFNSRFAAGEGTNPEELIAAAHAGCFTMALSMLLGAKGFAPDRLETNAAVTLEQKDGGFAITRIDLTLVGSVPGIDDETFQAIAGDAKANCPVSKVLNAEITLDAHLQV
jgi:osmotically inducible protein OsmC